MCALALLAARSYSYSNNYAVIDQMVYYQTAYVATKGHIGAMDSLETWYNHNTPSKKSVTDFYLRICCTDLYNSYLGIHIQSSMTLYSFRKQAILQHHLGGPSVTLPWQPCLVRAPFMEGTWSEGRHLRKSLGPGGAISGFGGNISAMTNHVHIHTVSDHR